MIKILFITVASLCLSSAVIEGRYAGRYNACLKSAFVKAPCTDVAANRSSKYRVVSSRTADFLSGKIFHHNKLVRLKKETEAHCHLTFPPSFRLLSKVADDDILADVADVGNAPDIALDESILLELNDPKMISAIRKDLKNDIENGAAPPRIPNIFSTIQIPQRDTTTTKIPNSSPISTELNDFCQASVSLIKDSFFDPLFRHDGTDIDRDYARFYALETIARAPYFSYLSVLHLYETLGWWRHPEFLKIHFAESWNELHHLLIMEELGGNSKYFDRLIAQHVGFGYYWFNVIMYIVNPVLAYSFMEKVEEHAYHTYDKFVKDHGDTLRDLPAPKVAQKYYCGGDLYMFDEFQTGVWEEQKKEKDNSNLLISRRRPKCETLLDTFINIRDDEGEHVKTLQTLQQIESDLCSSNSIDDGCIVE